MNIKRIITLFAVSLISHFAVPFLALKLLEPLNFLGGILIIMLIINPLAAIWVGFISGKDIRKLWWFSPAFSALFLLGFWIIFAEIVLDMTTYAFIYLILCFISAFISHKVSSKRNEKKQKENSKEI